MFALALLSTSIPTGSERDAHRNSDCHAHADVAECRAYADACPSADRDAYTDVPTSAHAVLPPSRSATSCLFQIDALDAAAVALSGGGAAQFVRVDARRLEPSDLHDVTTALQLAEVRARGATRPPLRLR